MRPGAPALFLLTALLCAVRPASAADDEEWDNMEEYGRNDPHTEGGERYGEEEVFSGYPVDPGEPGDLYFDTTAEHRVWSPGWTGAFVAFGAHGGTLLTQGDFLDGSAWGPAVGVFGQVSTLNQMLDLHTTWRWARTEPTSNEQRLTLTRNSVDFSAGIHPFFIWIIGGDLFSYAMANVSLNVGPSMDWVSIRSDDDAQPNHSYRALGYHVGPTIGLPVDNTQDGNSTWLEFAYTYKNVGGDRDQSSEFHQQHLREHWLTLRISWRNNGNVFAGSTGPGRP